MRRIIALCGFILVASQAFAQWGEEEMSDKPSFKDRIFTGGGLGASFGSTYDYFSISPIIGYRLTQKVATGLSFMYRYSNYKTYTPHISTSDYGVSPFMRVSLFGPLFLHVEYEYLNYEYPITPTESERKGFSSVLAGGGFFQPVSRHAGLYASVLYNFSYQANALYYPYTSPIIFRVGITAGF
jgi:hypothetical protein